jgi:hypothetical protein
MRRKSEPDKAPAEQVIKDIRRATRRHFSAEDKIRIVLEGLRGEDVAPPLLVWAQFVTAFILLFAFPVLQSGALLQLLDCVANTSFYLPMGLVVGGKISP